jgi:uncharacterized delta-60 repeat protein
MKGSNTRKQGESDASFGNGGKTELKVDGYHVEPGGSELLRAMRRTTDGHIMLAMGCIPALRGWRSWLSRFLPRVIRPWASWQYGLARLTPTGEFDSSFGEQGVVIEPPLPEETLQGAQPLPMADGATVLVLRSQASDTWMLTRRTDTGELDAAFGINGYVNLNGIRPPAEPGVVKGFALPAQDDGFFFVGTTKNVEGRYGGIVFRFGASGRLDPVFAGKGYALVDVPLNPRGRITDAVLQDDGKIVLSTATSGGNARILRLLPTGQPDPAFGTNGEFVVTGDSADRNEIEKLAWSGEAGLWGAGTIMTRSPKVGLLVALDDTGHVAPGFNGGKLLEIHYGGIGAKDGIAMPIHLQTSSHGGVAVIGSPYYDGTIESKKAVIGRHLPSGALDRSFGEPDETGTPKGFYTVTFDRKGFNFIFFGIDVTDDHLTFELLSGDGAGSSNPDRVTVERFLAT